MVKVVYAYYHLGFECTQVFIGHHQVPPNSVRQLISRLNKLWKKMESGQDKKPKEVKPPKPPKPVKVPLTPEQKVQRAHGYYLANREKILQHQKHRRELKKQPRGGDSEKVPRKRQEKKMSELTPEQAEVRREANRQKATRYREQHPEKFRLWQIAYRRRKRREHFEST